MATINLTQLKKEKEASKKASSSFNNAPTIVLDGNGKSKVEESGKNTSNTNYDFSDRTVTPVQRKTQQNIQPSQQKPVVTTAQTQQIINPTQVDSNKIANAVADARAQIFASKLKGTTKPESQNSMLDSIKTNAGYIGEKALKGAPGAVASLGYLGGTLVDNAGSTLDYIYDKVGEKNDAVKLINTLADLTDVATKGKITQSRKSLDESELLNQTAGAIKDKSKDVMDWSKESSYDPEEISTGVQLAGDVVGGISQMVPSIAATVATKNPTVGKVMMSGTAAGNALDEALKDGASYEDALTHAIATGTVEYVLESLGGSLPFLGEGKLATLAKGFVEKNLQGPIGKQIFGLAADALGEGFEEYLSEVIGEYLTDIYTDAKKEDDIITRFMNVQDEALYSALIGGLTGAVMNVPSTVRGLSDNTSQSAEVQKTPTEKDPIKSMINEDAKAEAQKIVETPSETQFDSNFLGKGLKSDDPMIRYESQRLSKEATINSARKTGVDVKKATKIADYANKVGIRVEFKDLTYTDKKGKTVTPEGMYQNGVIYISPKTVNPMYQVFKHELTHYIEDSDSYQDFQNVIFSLYDADTLNVMRENLRRERNDIVDEFGNDEVRLASEIDKELTAILSQDKIFTDKKTIDQLAQKKPNIVQTVYRWIKNKLAVARGEMTAEELKIMETAEKLYREALENVKNKSQNSSASKSTGLNANKLSERRKDLMAVHNLSETNLKKSLELGGMPYPSIAVTKDSIGHDQYGDVSLVFGKETIDPENTPRNRVYTRDAWTPTFPSIEYKLNEKNFQKANRYLKSLDDKMDPFFSVGMFLLDYKGDDSTTNTIDDLWEKAEKDNGLKAAYLESIGEHVTPISTTKKGGPRYSDKVKNMYENWFNTLSQEEYDDLLNGIKDKDFVKKYGDSAERLRLAELMTSKNISEEKARKLLENEFFGYKTIAIYNAQRYMFNKDDILPDKVEYDYNAINKMLEEKIDKSEYKKWVVDTFGGMFGKAGIGNNKEVFTKTGNRRSFDKLHDDYTAENVLNIMRAESKKAASNNPDLNAVFASASGEFRSIQDIIENENVLSEETELTNERYESLQDNFYEIRNKYTIKEGQSGYEAALIDTNFMRASVDAFSGKYTTSSVLKKFKEYGFYLTSEDANKLIDIIDGSKELSTDYFEAKPERVVGFDEVNAAVIPNTLSEDIKEMLRERGVNMVEYDPSVEGDRQRVMNSLEDAKFSRGLNADLLANLATEKNITQKVVGYNRAQSDTLNKINGGYARGRTSSIMKQIAAEVVNSGGNYSEELRNELLDEIWNTAYTVDESNLDVYAGVRDYFKNVKMKLTDSAKAEISDYNSWRKSVSNRLHFAKDGRSIDDVYQELQSLYGEVFPDVNSEGEMLEVMADVYDYEKSKRVHLSELGVKKEDFAKDFDDILEEFKNNILYRSNKKFLDTVARKSLQKSKADMAQRALQVFGDVSDDVKVLLEEHESSEGYRTSEDWSTLVPQIKSYGALSKTLSQVLDVVANSNPEVRARLYNAIEKPLYEAKKTYTTRTRKNVSKVYDEVVSKYNIKKGSKESEALMWYGEKTKSLWNKKQGKLETMPYSLDDLKKDMPNSWQNIVEADKVMRQIYDDYVDSLNDVLSVIYPNIEIKAKYELNKLKANVASLVEQKKQLEEMDLVHAKPETLALYSQVLKDLKANRTKMSNLTNQINSGDYYANKRVNKRSDYYHHFYELTASDTLQDIFDMNASNNISNALAGKSEFTKPKSKFAGFMQHRGMGKYEADAIASILDYIPKAEYKIAFDPVITEYRDIISNIVKESGEEYDNTEFINWFTNYTNDLAGKTNPIDRVMSHSHSGRKIIKALRSLNNFVKGKTIVGNLASATSQFFNMPNGVALLKHRGGLNAVKDVTLGQKDYLQYIGNKVLRKSDSSPINDSVFLSERYLDGIYSKFDTGILDNVNKMRTWLLQVGDQAVSENLWFSAYEQALRLEKSNPIEYADNLVRDAVAGRGVGEIPLTQKSELVKLLAPFQVEVNNTWNLIKSLSGVQLEGSGLKELAKNLLGGDERDYIALLTLFVITYFMNNPKEELTGNRTGFDPIDAIIDTYEKMAKEENASTGDWIASAAGRVGGEILSNMPGGNWWTTAAGLTGYDAEAFFGEADPSRFGTGVTGVQAVVDPLMQFAVGKNVDWQSILTNLTPIGDKQTNRMYKMAEDAGLIPRIDWNRNDGLIINGNVVGKDQEGKKVPFNEIKWEEFFKDIKKGSYNDNNGLKYPIDVSDPINMAKGFAFGTYATKEGKEYIKEGYSALSKQNTEKYEDLVKDSAKNYSDEKTYYDYFRQKEDNSYANAELLNQKAMQDAIKKIIEEGPTETDENGIVTSKYDYSDFGTTEKAMKAYAGAIAKGIDFNIIEEASKIKSVQKQDGERDSKAITHSAAALVRKFYEEKGIYKKIVDYCNHSKDTDVTAFGLAEKVLNDAYYKKVLSEIEKVRKGKK